jgi:hypothetical protein
MLPEAHRLAPDQPGVGAACQRCQAEHSREVGLFEDLGHLLADVRAFARRGRKVGAGRAAGRLAGWLGTGTQPLCCLWAQQGRGREGGGCRALPCTRQLAAPPAHRRRPPPAATPLQEVSAMLAQLATMAERVCDAITAHMLHEEAEVIPLLRARLGVEQQRQVWPRGGRCCSAGARSGCRCPPGCCDAWVPGAVPPAPGLPPLGS